MVINGKQAIRMPQKGNSMLKLQNFHKQLPVPFVIYSDFEAITVISLLSYTESYQKHTGCSYGYKFVCCYDDQYTKPARI